MLLAHRSVYWYLSLRRHSPNRRAPEVIFISPCECQGFHGKNRWIAKTDLTPVPLDKSVIQSVTPRPRSCPTCCSCDRSTSTSRRYRLIFRSALRELLPPRGERWDLLLGDHSCGGTVGYKSAMSSSSATIAAIHAQMMMRIGNPMIRYGIKLDAVASTLLTKDLRGGVCK